MSEPEDDWQDDDVLAPPSSGPTGNIKPYMTHPPVPGASPYPPMPPAPTPSAFPPPSGFAPPAPPPSGFAPPAQAQSPDPQSLPLPPPSPFAPPFPLQSPSASPRAPSSPGSELQAPLPGVPLPLPRPPAPGLDPYGLGIAGGAPGDPRLPWVPPAGPPPSYLGWAIVSTIMCCFPLGIVSIVFAASVDSRWSAGDLAGAWDASRKAKQFARWSAITAGIVIGLYGLLAIVASVLGN